MVLSGGPLCKSITGCYDDGLGLGSQDLTICCHASDCSRPTPSPWLMLCNLGLFRASFNQAGVGRLFMLLAFR